MPSETPVLSVHIPDNNIPERVYAIHSLLFDRLGLKYQLQIDPSLDDYHIGYQGKLLTIKDGFFNTHPGVLDYLNASNIPVRVTRCHSPELTGQTILFGSDRLDKTAEGITCHLDIVAGTFFMLTRWEELVLTTRDRHDRFPASASLAARAGFLDRPIVDEYVELLRSCLMHIGVYSGAFKTSEYRTVITVDADYVRFWGSPKQALRKIGGALVRDRSPGSALRLLFEYIKYLMGSADPYDTFGMLEELMKKAGIRGCFNFMSGGQHKLDPGFTVKDNRVSRLIEGLIARGHSIGFHPSYDTIYDAHLFSKEYEDFVQQTGIRTGIGRHHFLRFRVPFTWRLWESVGAYCDMTMGYAALPGFRCGTCHAFNVFDVVQRRMLRLKERPLIVMDTTLLHYMSESPERAIKLVVNLQREVRRHKGEFVVLWHNSSFYPGEWKGYEEVIRQIIHNGHGSA